MSVAAKGYQRVKERNTVVSGSRLLLRKALALTVDWNVPALTKKVLQIISERSVHYASGSNAEVESALYRALKTKKEAVVSMLLNYPVRPTANCV